MAQQSLRSFDKARRKACERLGCYDKQFLPSNADIQIELQRYLQLFHADAQADLQRSRWQTAHRLMQRLEIFQPRLVGALIHGTADQHTPIQLHVFADPEEQILQWLLDKSISYQLSQRRMQFSGQRYRKISVCNSVFEGVPVELLLFNSLELREAPRSPVDGKPQRRLKIQELEELLAELT